MLFALACVRAPAPPPRPPVERPRAALPALPALAPGAAPARRLVLVLVEGLAPTAYLGANPPMPVLARLAEAGAAAIAMRPVFPPALAPAATTLVTGALPAHHGIVADRRIGEHGVRAERYEHASQVQVPTLWGIAAAQGRSVAALGWPVTAGASLPWLLPALEPSHAGASWFALARERSTASLRSLLDALAAPTAELDRPGPARDALLVSLACSLLESNPAPDLLLLGLGGLEAAARESAPGSARWRAALARLDTQIGRVVACLGRTGRLGESALAVAGDRGLLAVHTRLRPNALLARAGLVSVGSDGKAITRWRALARSNGGSAFVYARNEEAALEARRVFEEAAERTRAFRLLSAARMLELGADPQAWFGLLAAPGFVFDDGLGEVIAPAAGRGAGGYLPARPEMASGFVLWGPGVRSGVRVPRLAQQDVAPTLARLLGLELGASDGRVVVGILTPRALGERRPAAGG